MSTSNARPGQVDARQRGDAAAPRVDRGASGLAEVRRDEARRAHRDRVRAAVLRARDRDAALRRRRSSSSSTSSAAQERQVGGDDRDERRVHDLGHRRRERVVPGEAAVVEPDAVAVERLGGDDRDPLDARLLDGSRPRARAASRISSARSSAESAPASRLFAVERASAERARGRPRRDLYRRARMLIACSTGPSRSCSPRRGACAAASAGRHLLAEGLHPADEALPGRLPLLHVRRGRPAGASARTSRPTRCWTIARAGAAAGCTRGAVHARRQARAPLPRRARGARRARLRDDDRVPRADVPSSSSRRPACSRTRTPA